MFAFFYCLKVDFCFTIIERLTDWSVREAFLQVHRREKLGLPVIDKNLVDPSLIELPSDEELGDTEIII